MDKLKRLVKLKKGLLILELIIKKYIEEYAKENKITDNQVNHLINFLLSNNI